MSVFLGIDTSCYRTSAAVVDDHGRVLRAEGDLLPVSAGERGLRQSEAVFAHLRQLPSVCERALAGVSGDIAAVCVSQSPRDGEDSYMPVFVAGTTCARLMAQALRAPLYTTSHQRGHIRAALVDSGLTAERFLAVHLSGGTTETLLCEDEGVTRLSGTRDLHAGQLVDRVGVAMGLPFPAGPSLEKLAVSGRGQSRIPVSMEGGDCHFSGAEARALAWLQDDSLSREEIAAEVYGVIARTVLRMLTAAAEQTGARDALIAGGVASSALLRVLLAERCEKRGLGLRLFFGKREYSGDNAVGVALIGREQYLKTVG